MWIIYILNNKIGKYVLCKHDSFAITEKEVRKKLRYDNEKILAIEHKDTNIAPNGQVVRPNRDISFQKIIIEREDLI